MDMVKVRKFEDGLKFEDGHGHANDKRKEGQSSSSLGKELKVSSSRGFQGQGRDYSGQGHIRAPS